MESKGLADAYRQELAARMRERATSMEDAIVERIRREEESLTGNGGRVEEIRTVIQAVFEHGFGAIEGKEEHQLPPEVVTHARALAWEPLPPYALPVRYAFANTVFKEHLRQASCSIKQHSQTGHADAERAIDRLFERVVSKAAEEHHKEGVRLKASPEARRLETIKQLLAAQLIYPPEDLGYDFSATHIGVVGSGPGVKGEIKRLAKMLGGQLLIVQACPNQSWAWIGLKVPKSAERLDDVLKAKWKPTVRLALGDPVAGLDGWRHTYREANAAFAVAVCRPGSVVRYAKVQILAVIAQNDFLQRSLRTEFLEPLLHRPEGGRDLVETLCRYFALGRNGRCTAADLGVSPQTITNRLKRVEKCLGRPIQECGIGLEAAVLLADLTMEP
ncbi:MAG: PucR family transcriptional regulator [Solirubrobacterales bacterium]